MPLLVVYIALIHTHDINRDNHARKANHSPHNELTVVLKILAKHYSCHNHSRCKRDTEQRAPSVVGKCFATYLYHKHAHLLGKIAITKALLNCIYAIVGIGNHHNVEQCNNCKAHTHSDILTHSRNLIRGELPQR